MDACASRKPLEAFFGLNHTSLPSCWPLAVVHLPRDISSSTKQSAGTKGTMCYLQICPGGWIRAGLAMIHQPKMGTDSITRTPRDTGADKERTGSTHSRGSVWPMDSTNIINSCAELPIPSTGTCVASTPNTFSLVGWSTCASHQMIGKPGTVGT